MINPAMGTIGSKLSKFLLSFAKTFFLSELKLTQRRNATKPAVSNTMFSIEKRRKCRPTSGPSGQNIAVLYTTRSPMNMCCVNAIKYGMARFLYLTNIGMNAIDQNSKLCVIPRCTIPTLPSKRSMSGRAPSARIKYGFTLTLRAEAHDLPRMYAQHMWPRRSKLSHDSHVWFLLNFNGL